MINTCKYAFKPIDEVRGDLIGLKITDIEPKGRAIHLIDSNGRTYTMDTTGEKEVVVRADASDSEKIKGLEKIIEALMQVLNVTDDKILETIYEGG